MEGVVRHQTGVKLAVSHQQGFSIGTRQMDTALVDGYPRRQDVKSLHLITHCCSIRFGFGPGVALRDPSRGRELYREDWPSMAGGFGVEAEVLCQGNVSCGLVDCELSTEMWIGRECGVQGHSASVSRVRHVESVDSFAPG